MAHDKPILMEYDKYTFPRNPETQKHTIKPAANGPVNVKHIVEMPGELNAVVARILAGEIRSMIF